MDHRRVQYYGPYIDEVDKQWLRGAPSIIAPNPDHDRHHNPSGVLLMNLIEWLQIQLVNAQNQRYESVKKAHGIVDELTKQIIELKQIIKKKRDGNDNKEEKDDGGREKKYSLSSNSILPPRELIENNEITLIAPRKRPRDEKEKQKDEELFRNARLRRSPYNNDDDEEKDEEKHLLSSAINNDVDIINQRFRTNNVAEIVVECLELARQSRPVNNDENESSILSNYNRRPSRVAGVSLD